MTLNANQIARLSAAATDCEYRVYTGGRRGTVIEQDLTEGATYTATASSTLASRWDGVSTTITLTDASGFTDSGGIYLPPAADSYPGYPVAYLAKWISYTGKSGNDLTGCALAYDMEDTAEQAGTYFIGHPSGTTATQWADITDNVIAVEFAESADDEIATWRATIHGIGYDSRKMAQNNACLIFVRWQPNPSTGNNWSDDLLLCGGYIAGASSADDWQQAARFSLTVRPIDLYLENADAPARRYGLANLASGATTNSSAELGDPSLIGHAGEIIGSPDLDAAQTVDESLATLYVSAATPNKTAGTAPASSGGPFIGEIGYGPTGSGANGAYCVIWSRGEHSLGHYDLWTAPSHDNGATLGEALIDATDPPTGGYLDIDGIAALPELGGVIRIQSTGEEITYDQADYTVNSRISNITRGANGTTAAAASAAAVVLTPETLILKAHQNKPDLPQIANGDRVILCRHRETFESWANVEGVEIIEWRALDLPFQRGTKLTSPTQAGDRLILRGANVPGAAYNDVHTVYWGSEATGSWPAGSIGYGQSLRCTDLSAPATDTNWEISDAPSPAQNLQAATHAWISAEVDQFAITLNADIDASVATVQITPTSAGLFQAGGTIQIDTEQIAYTAASQVSGSTYQLTGCTRGANATTPAAHTAGATIYQVEDATASLDERIGRIGWRRKRVLDANGAPIVPADFEIWISRQASPTYPDDDDATITAWRSDWSQIATAAGHTGIEWYTPDAWTGGRARHVMVLINEMTDAGRALLNEMEFYRDGSTDPAETAQNTAGDLISYVLQNDFGLPAVQVDAAAVGPIGTQIVSARTRYTDLIRQIARLTGSVAQITRDNIVRFYRSPWHPLGSSPLSGSPEIIHEFDRSSGRRITIAHGQRNRIAQIRLTARNPDSGETYAINHPPAARTLGETVEIDRIFYGAAAEARYLAEYLYIQASTQTEINLIPTGHADGIRIWDRVTLTWSADAAGDLYNGRNFLVTGIALTISHPANGPKAAAWSITLKEYTT